MKDVLCFGNEDFKEDRLAMDLAKVISLRDFRFIPCTNVTDILEQKGRELFIMDVVKDLRKVTLINDVDKLQENRLSSLHDFDIAFFLKLMKESGKIDKVNIIGLPQLGDKELIKRDVVSTLKRIGDGNE